MLSLTHCHRSIYVKSFLVPVYNGFRARTHMFWKSAYMMIWRVRVQVSMCLETSSAQRLAQSSLETQAYRPRKVH